MSTENTYRIQVKGLVQGVGFRPFVYRIAHQHRMKGWVENRNDGVLIQVNCTEDKLRLFIEDIKTGAPPASNITAVSHNLIEKENFGDFTIVKSQSTSDEITDVSPDIAVCDACIEDMKVQEHRLDYPFINCTNCGPRFSIIRDLPYDRHKTTMEPFVMCETCQKEYTHVLDRRFHAQPVACSVCGPEYELNVEGRTINEFEEILNVTSTLLQSGKIVAIKGIGGFQIACDAQNEKVVQKLRLLKNREGKPFAVMFRDEETVLEYTTLFPEEKRAITSWRKPIVIVSDKKRLAPSVSVGFPTVGAMLPYMPFHYLLFEKLDLPAIVLTSGNISDEPIVIDNKEAEKILSKVADAILYYNRDIYNRTDDSVVISMNEMERMIRRSRGYSPEPVNIDLETEGIFAAGAELVNCFALGKGKQAILSQHIGDLKNLETLEFYSESFERYKKLFRVNPRLAVHDKHPDYLSTKFAKALGIRTLEVQHHHAHIASGMAEHKLDEKVIGISMDGTGLGDDGHIWGGDFFICDLVEYIRFSHFEYVPLPGGDKVTSEPWRSGVSYLYKSFGKKIFDEDLPFMRDLDPEKIQIVLQAIDKKINSPLSSSAGRLFDAIAAITNVCTNSKFHAEAPMRLEAMAHPGTDIAYPFDMDDIISFRSTLQEILIDQKTHVGVEIISAKFHNTFINVIFAVANLIRKKTGIKKVVLSGGTFQNKYILSRIEQKLEKDGFAVFSQQKIPSNDGGIALGQLAIAAKKIQLGLLNRQSLIINH